jgi:hypothetical protein
MYYRTHEPYFAVRTRPAGDDRSVLVGGQNHRTGHGGSTAERYRALEREARERLDVEARLPVVDPGLRLGRPRALRR